MRNKILSVSIFLLGSFFSNCNDYNTSDSAKQLPKTKEEIEKEKILKMGKEIAFREYGDVIKKELPLHAKLVGDSVWIIEGTLQKGSDGGTVYIEISNSDNKILKITHYK